MALAHRRNQLLLVCLLLVTGCSDAPQPRAVDASEASSRATPSGSPTVAPPGSPGPGSTARAAANPSPSPTEQQGLELRGDDLGVTRIGDAKSDAVAAVERHLGPADTSPEAVSCVSGVSEVEWPDLRLSFDADDRLNGWTVGTSRLATPSGVRVGTTVAELRRIYGGRLRLHPPNPDHGWSYTISQVDMVGSLDGSSDDSRVTGLSNGACTGP